MNDNCSRQRLGRKKIKFQMSEKTEAGAKAPWLNPKWANLLGRFLALVIVFAFFALLVDDGKFYTLRNLENILRQSCVYATAVSTTGLLILTFNPALFD